MDQRKRLALVSCVMAGLCSVSFLSGVGWAQVGTERYIVRMTAVSLVGAAAADPDGFERDEDGRLNLDSAAARAYLEAIDSDHAAFRDALAEAAPNSRIVHEYRILFNGFVVSGVDAAEVAALSSVDYVNPTDGVFYYPLLDASADAVGAPVFWDNLGGVGVAGEGIRIAIIDSGININNRFFSPDDFTLPGGFPKGDVAHTNAKVIAARAYFRPDDPVDGVLDDTTPVDYLGHGTHAAGIAAGNSDTVFDLIGEEIEVSGLAPRAQLMNYKVFYQAESGERGATEPELIAAFEDAVKDGAHIISCSWGGPDLLGLHARSAEVYLAAIDAGVTVVFAAGNSGPGRGSIAYPASLRRVISVGATLTGRGFSGWIDVHSPEPIPAHMRGIPAVVGQISPEFYDSIGPAPILLAKKAGLPLSDDGCLPFPVGAFEGAVALIPRGDCTFSSKVHNAAEAGALAVVILNTFGNALPFEMAGDSVEIPAVLLGYDDSFELEKWVNTRLGTEVTIHPGLISYPRESEHDTIWYNSSVGPTDRFYIKPELVAPGATQIISAAAGNKSGEGSEWAIRKGTSSSAAHVSGAAALLRQRHPEWDHNDVKSALVGSAVPDVLPAPAPPLGIGAGRLDLARADSLEWLSFPALLSLGQGTPGHTFEETITFSQIGDSSPAASVLWESRFGALPPLYLPASGSPLEVSGDLDIQIKTSADYPIGEYAGYLRLVGSAEQVLVSVPYHFRLIPEMSKDLLLLDMSFGPEESELSILYSNMAAKAGLDWDYYRATEIVAVPTLAELKHYRAVLVFTGNDQTMFKGVAGDSALGVLATYMRQGGGLIVTGQGPFRGSDHLRFRQLTGAETKDTFPFVDDSGELIERGDYLVSQALVDPSSTLPLDLTPTGSGLGDLEFAGELEPIRGAELPALWTEPFLTMENVGETGLTCLGLAFDPYRGWGVHSEAEQLTHRAVWMGFGFEQIRSDVTSAVDRQSFFEAVLTWTMDEIEISISLEQDGLETLFTVHTERGEAVYYEYDLGNEKVTRTASNTLYRMFDTHGSKHLRVVAWSRSGAAARADLKFEISPLPDASVADEKPDWKQTEPRTRDCGCNTVGESIEGASLFGSVLHAISI